MHSPSERQEASPTEAVSVGGQRQSAAAAPRRSLTDAIAASAALIAGTLLKMTRSAPSRRPALWALGGAGAIALCLYIAATAVLYLEQRSLMYFPETVHTTPAQAGFPEAKEVPLTASDGVHVTAWYVPPQDGKPVIVFFHGNGGALRYSVPRFRKLVGAGIGLVALEYRGYGGNPGSPSERGLIADGEAAYAFAAARYPAKQIVLWGHSLGTGVAVAVAAREPIGRLILEAPFTSAAAVAALRYWYMPVRLLMKDQFHSDRLIKKVTAPLLILHGVRDKVVPFWMGERLFKLANKPKYIVRFLDGGHDNLDANGALFAVARFLAGDMDPQPPAIAAPSSVQARGRSDRENTRLDRRSNR